jgi:hypothetical protein
MHQPYTKSFVDDNLPGGIFEKTPYIGFCHLDVRCPELVSSLFVIIQQTPQPKIPWKRKWMQVISLERPFIGLIFSWRMLTLPFSGPIPLAEDNSDMHIITHTGKITRKVCLVVLKALSISPKSCARMDCSL